jgi:phosphate transport system permease protein
VKETLRESYPEVSDRRERRALSPLVSSAASFRLREVLLENPEWLGSRRSIAVPLSAEADMLLKGAISRESPPSERVDRGRPSRSGSEPRLFYLR